MEGEIILKLSKSQRDYIMKNPYSCDECSDVYNKDDLIDYDDQLRCKNCMDNR